MNNNENISAYRENLAPGENTKISEIVPLNLVHMNPDDELKHFLKEYMFFEKNERQEYYYLIPFDWLLKWQNFIINPWYFYYKTAKRTTRRRLTTMP
jgi:hypothetical protein